MKKEIVIKVQIKCNRCRIKAMKLAASLEGVDSIMMGGEDKDELVLIGDGIDPVCFTHTLRKKLGHANIVQVKEVKEETNEAEEKTDAKAPEVTWYPHYPPCPPVIYYDDSYCYGSSNPNICSIM